MKSLNAELPSLVRDAEDDEGPMLGMPYLEFQSSQVNRPYQKGVTPFERNGVAAISGSKDAGTNLRVGETESIL